MAIFLVLGALLVQWCCALLCEDAFERAAGVGATAEACEGCPGHAESRPSEAVGAVASDESVPAGACGRPASPSKRCVGCVCSIRAVPVAAGFGRAHTATSDHGTMIAPPMYANLAPRNPAPTSAVIVRAVDPHQRRSLMCVWVI